MARLMSVAFTAPAVINRTKHVTRRKGWVFLSPGDRLVLCRKVMGRRPGEPLERLAYVEIVDVKREPLAAMLDDTDYGNLEMIREGFPNLTPAEFIQTFFVDAQHMELTDWVTRIEWKYLEEKR